MASIVNNQINSQYENNEEKTKTSTSKENQNFSSFLLSWGFKNIKLFGIRLLYCIYNSKNLLKKSFSAFLNNIISNFFSLSTARFSLGITTIPLLHKLFSLLKDYLNVKIDKNLFESLSMCISSFISALIIEKSTFTNYILISIVLRIIHNYISQYLSSKNILQTKNKIYSYIIIAIPCIIWMLLMDYHPSYLALVKPTDAYSNFTKEEIIEMNYIRNKKKLV